jgi:hypothetical protein
VVEAVSPLSDNELVVAEYVVQVEAVEGFTCTEYPLAPVTAPQLRVTEEDVRFVVDNVPGALQVVPLTACIVIV